MRASITILRIVLTVLILAALLVFIQPIQILEDPLDYNWRWLGLALCMVPLFLFCRIYKWLLLERQVLGSTTLVEILPHYLWGMAVGLVTPGRVGELVRVRAPKLSARGGGLFFLEKTIEVICLFSLCLLTLLFLGFLPRWVLVLAVLCLAIALASWSRLMTTLLTLMSRMLGRPSPERLKTLIWTFSNLRIRGCAVLSLACFLIYIIQAYFVLCGLGVTTDPSIIFLFPLVLLANLIPITVGGYGVRETLAIVVLNLRDIPEAKAAVCVALVTFFDLVVPGIFGAILRILRGAPAPTKHQPPEQKAVSVKTGEWDVFWKGRKQRPLGRLLVWFRQRFVTTTLAKYIHRNTKKGTLIEAGCGSGEITLQVAARRGDQVVLVDQSPLALAMAKRLAQQYRIDARIVECDIAKLSTHIRSARENIVYNIGVIEHFPDPSGILREMARVSGPYAIAVIPKRSIFWLVFFHISRFLGLVPSDFFVQFYSRKQLASLITDAGLKVQWLRGVRIFGLIPYLGVCYSLISAEEGKSSRT